VNRAAAVIEALRLLPHPEGGRYRETYRAAESIPRAALPGRFPGDRPFATAILFLLQRPDVSRLHRLRSDELWHFHAGSPLVIHIIAPGGGRHHITLGLDFDSGQVCQAIVPAGVWFGAEVGEGDGPDYALVLSAAPFRPVSTLPTSSWPTGKGSLPNTPSTRTSSAG
jgi:predicted cupin superfamily sugar epimerase